MKLTCNLFLLSLSLSSSSFNFCSRLIEKERFLRYVSFNVLQKKKFSREKPAFYFLDGYKFVEHLDNTLSLIRPRVYFEIVINANI